MRRLTVTIATTALLCLTAVIATAQDQLPASPKTPAIDLDVQPVLCGDANNDGTVSAADIVAISNYVIGRAPSPFNEDAADVNTDGKIDIRDIAIVIQYVATSGE